MLLFLLACRHASPTGPTWDDDAWPPPVDESAVLYDAGLVHDLAITLDPADWDTLRHQSRSMVQLLQGDCLAQPFASPYTYFVAQASFDGEAMGEVGLRKKGLIGSQSTTRPSLRIDADQYVDGGSFHGLEHMVFNNNNQDLSRMRTCLAHGLFADAGLVAPRCSIAHVTVNGEDLGLYDNTEAIDAHLIERLTGEPPATLYEGTLSDFRDGWLGTFDPKDDASDGQDLAVVTSVLDQTPDATLIAALDPLVDMDQFFSFWAAESLAGHWDSYNGNTNNFYVYRSASDGLLRFIASGPDATFDSAEPFGVGQPVWVVTVSVLANRLIQIPEGRERYEAAMRTLLDDVWDGERRLAQIDAWKDLTHDYTTRDERRAIGDLRDIVEARSGSVEAQLGGDVPATALRGNPCFVDVGAVRVDFETTFGSYPGGDLYGGGTAETSWVISDQTYTSTKDGVTAGYYSDEEALWFTISEVAADTWLAAYVVFDVDLLSDGAVIRLDDGGVQAYLLYNSADTNGQWATAAYLGDGTLSFTQASAADGATLTGVLDGTVLGSGG